MNDDHLRNLDDDALGRLLRDSRQLLSAPDALVRRMIGLAQPFGQPTVATPASPAAGLGDTVRRLLRAVLAHDSWAPGVALEAVRSTGSDARQLLFEAGEHDVDVRVQRSAVAGVDGWVVSGQLLGPQAGAGGAGRVVLRCGGFEAAMACSDLGEFRFEPVPHGLCELLVEGEGWSAALPAFRLATAAPGSDA